MRCWLRISCLVLLLGVVGNTAIAGESKAVQTMAGILLNLNHLPTNSDQQALNRIADDKSTTAHERVVAQALSNVQHEVRVEDKPKLEALIHDQAAPESLKTLASVILTLHHTPSAGDKEKLKSLVP